MVTTIESYARQYSKTFKMFIGCMQLAKKGKTFLYVHPEFVAIDKETWNVMQSKLRAPVIYYNEAQFISDKDLNQFEKEFKKFKK